MHKKSQEITKKCPSPRESDSTRSDSFCDSSVRRSVETREAHHETREEQEELLVMEEEEETEEEVAIDLSSSSKQQQEVGSSIRPASSLRRHSGSESDDRS
ncbi:visual system homeobox 1-like, partial [Anarrhichthys ocellatus]|uniref:visual system homeobox 1-like n=1 Tax=Anarrhichthys ocellatus TaxID=433405 RepID=UPI0012EEC0CA